MLTEPSTHSPATVAPARDPLIEACLSRYGQMMRGLLHVRASSGLPWNELNITLPQIRVLSLLAGRERGLSGRELAGLLGVGPSAVTPLVDRLVEHGYVRREEDRADRRITRLLLTPAGLTALQQMAAGRREVLAEVLEQLNPSELAQVEQAFALVQRGITRVSETVADAPLVAGAACAIPSRMKKADSS